MKLRARRITAAIIRALASIGLTPDTPHLQQRLQFTRTGRLRYLLGNNQKVIRGEARKVLTAIMHLAPHKQSGFNVCSFAGDCANMCIDKTGQNVTGAAYIARVSRTLLYALFPEAFFAQFEMELGQHKCKATWKDMAPAVRPNGTSDILWEQYGIVDKFPEIQWYDYTKVPLDKRKPPPNYHLTYSVSEAPGSMARALEYLEAGHNAAIVVQSADGMTRTTAKQEAARILDAGQLHGFPVLDGDVDDIRFFDPPGHWVVLYAKGPATKSPDSGFVYRGHSRLTLAA